jgi:hypothetical protein
MDIGGQDGRGVESSSPPEQYKSRASTAPSAPSAAVRDVEGSGTYTAVLRLPLIRIEHQVRFGTGWPSFWAAGLEG